MNERMIQIFVIQSTRDKKFTFNKYTHKVRALQKRKKSGLGRRVALEVFLEQNSKLINVHAS